MALVIDAILEIEIDWCFCQEEQSHMYIMTCFNVKVFYHGLSN